MNSTKTFVLNVRADVPGFEFVQSEIKVGDQDSERGTQAQAQFQIKNTGTQTIQGFTISNDISSKYNPIVSFDTATPLAANEVRTGIVFIDIPDNQDSERDTIGKITVSGEATSINLTKKIDVSLEAESMLSIDNIEINAKEDDDSNVDNDDTIDFLKEGEEIDVVVSVENLYNEDDDYDYEIKSVYVEVESNQDWFSKVKSDKVNINPEDTKDISFPIKLDDEIDDDTSKVYFRVYGEDKENDFTHYDEWELTFEIDRATHEITIKSAEITTSSRYGGDEEIQAISCDQNDAAIRIELKNTGLRDEDEVMVRVTSPSSDLDFSRSFREMTIDEGDYKTVTATFAIPEDLRVGDLYTYTVNTYYNNDEDSDEQAYLVKYVCDSDNSNQNDNDNSGSDNNTADDNQDTNNNNNDNVVDINDEDLSGMVHSEPTGKFSAFRGTNGYIIVLTVLVVLLLIAVVYIGSLAMKKK